MQQTLGDKAGLATSLSNIGAVYDTVRDEQQALEYYTKALPLTRETGDKAQEGVTLKNIGVVYENLREEQKAFDYYNQALPLLQATKNQKLVEKVLESIADIKETQNSLGVMQK